MPTTPLGQRRLKIYRLTDQGWSKRQRDRADGIGGIFKLIQSAGVLDEDAVVCIVTNKDDASEDDPRLVLERFRRPMMMPHNSRGQNRFTDYHQLIHCAVLNSYTPDVTWMEAGLGIDSTQQRLARTGQELPVLDAAVAAQPAGARGRGAGGDASRHRGVASQWFTPAEQVEVTEIDSSGVVRRKGKPGRPRAGALPMSPAERKRLERQRRREAPAGDPSRNPSLQFS